VATADNVQLIQMLFDGLLESLATARGHIENRNILGKSSALSRACRIVVGLQGALDFERGGELANNLNELYSYMTRRMLHANANNDVETLSEVASLVRDISEAWRTLPGLLGDSGSRQVHYAS
jgi:flagellar protein FliS